ncbi:MAG: murein biosynthesis integral membrane protein MurJ [Xanthobacter sp.]
MEFRPPSDPATPVKASALRARSSIVSAATLGSRLLGFVRDAATAAVLGAGPVADALTAALSLPLVARRLLAEGAFNLAFLPALARERAEPARLARATVLVLAGALALAALLGALFMPQLIDVLAPGFRPDGPRADVAIWCGRIALLYLPLAGLSAVYGGIANGARRVLLPALAPMAANVTVLAVIGILLWRGLMESDTAALAIAAATVAAGVSQLALMLWAARGCDAAPGFGGISEGDRGAAAAPSSAMLCKAVGILRTALPALLFAGLSQFRLMIVAALVSGTDGAVAALNYAQRLMDLPLGLVGASAGAVLLPALLQQERKEGDGPAASAVLAVMAFALPAATGLAVLTQPIVATLFQRGSFTAQDTQVTALFLAVLALSLPLQGLERVLSATAAAAGLMRRAEKLALLSLLLCLLAGLGMQMAGGMVPGLSILAHPEVVAGAVVGSALFSSIGLLVLLWRAGHLRLNGRAILWLAGLGVACLLMALAVMALEDLTRAMAAPGLAGAPRLALLIGCGMGVYGLALVVLRAIVRFPR